MENSHHGNICVMVVVLLLFRQTILGIVIMILQLKFNHILQIAISGKLSLECLIRAEQGIVTASHFFK